MSVHKVEIIEIKEVLPHPNADNLQLTSVFGWQCCIGKDQFKVGDKAVYVEPDMMVPVTRPEFAFLAKRNKMSGEIEGTQARITVRRFRGAMSQGLLIKVPAEFADLPVGSNVIEALQIERYEPPLPKSTYGNFVSAPSGLYAPKFDVENHQRYAALFSHGEEVVVTEKLHGANARFVWAKNAHTGEFEQFCGSRTNWMGQDETNIWWMAFRQNPSIGEWCQNNPEKIMYGEVFGFNKGMKYGANQNGVLFAAFAILEKQTWLDYDVCQALIKPFPGLKWAPVVYRGPFDLTVIGPMAELDSVWFGANHMREGVVIVPKNERHDAEIGRVCLKIVSNRYLEKS